MPKLSGLPEATSMDGNDLLLISDMLAGQSKGIKKDNFNQIVLSSSYLAGFANQGLVLPADGAITYLSGFQTGSPNANPAGGQLTSSKEDFKISMTMEANQAASPQKDAGVALWLQLSDVSNTIAFIVEEQWFIHVKQLQGYLKFTGVIIGAALPVPLFGPITCSFGVQGLAKTISMNLARSSISIEDL